MAYNTFDHEGAVAMAEVIKYNNFLQTIDLAYNRLTFESSKVISLALKTNSSLKSLIVCEIFYFKFSYKNSFLCN